MKIPDFLIKFAGKYLSRKLDLKEGTAMDSKKWFQSKGVWTGIFTVLIGTYMGVDSQLGPQFGFNLPDIPEFVYVLLGALGIYSRVDAKSVIE